MTSSVVLPNGMTVSCLQKQEVPLVRLEVEGYLANGLTLRQPGIQRADLASTWIPPDRGPGQANFGLRPPQDDGIDLMRKSDPILRT